MPGALLIPPAIASLVGHPLAAATVLNGTSGDPDQGERPTFPLWKGYLPSLRAICRPRVVGRYEGRASYGQSVLPPPYVSRPWRSEVKYGLTSLLPIQP